MNKQGNQQESKMNKEIFARKNEEGDYDILYIEDGVAVTRLDSDSQECPEGIVLNRSAVLELCIPIEDEHI